MDFFVNIIAQPSTWVLGISAAVLMLYRYGTSTFYVFSEQGIPGPKPLPFVGNLWGIWKQNMNDIDVERVKKYGKVFGLFDALEPNLFIADPEIIKSILVKDFDHFVNHKDYGTNSKIVRKMIFFIRDQDWRNVHASLSPAFSAGKIKKMSGLIKQTVDRRASKLEILAKTEGKFNAKTFFAAATLDIITRAFYGLNIENLGEQGDPFITNALNLFNQWANQSTLILIPFLFPRFFSGDDMFLTEPWMFYKNVLENVIEERSKSTEKYNDFLEIASESITAYSKEKKIWTPEETKEIIIAQALELLVDGYETSATTLAYVSFMLARHPDVQEKLYEQVMEKMEQHGEVSHEMVLEMTYADQIISETLRLFPILPRLDRMCNKDISYNGIHIKKGMIVSIPVYAMQHSEEYYPDPEKFDPDRWSPENKSKINPYTYLPFGGGLRGCIGNRLAIEQIKIAICTFVQQFRFVPVQETMEKMKFFDGFAMVTISHDIILGVEMRNS